MPEAATLRGHPPVYAGSITASERHCGSPFRIYSVPFAVADGQDSTRQCSFTLDHPLPRTVLNQKLVNREAQIVSRVSILDSSIGFAAFSFFDRVAAQYSL
jgi:hypothetical protein